MIRVAIVAPTLTEQARLEAMVAALPRLRLISEKRAVLDADVLLMDSGPRPVETVLRALSPSAHVPPVVLLTGSDHSQAATGRLLRAGARAILPRDAPASDIAAAIDAVLVGLIVLHRSTAPVSLTGAARARPARGEARSDPLTPRELEILTMTAEGMSNRAIAQRLGISSHTVKFHIASILGKLNARSRTDAVMIGMRLGLLMV